LIFDYFNIAFLDFVFLLFSVNQKSVFFNIASYDTIGKNYFFLLTYIIPQKTFFVKRLNLPKNTKTAPDITRKLKSVRGVKLFWLFKTAV